MVFQWNDKISKYFSDKNVLTSLSFIYVCLRNCLHQQTFGFGHIFESFWYLILVLYLCVIILCHHIYTLSSRSFKSSRNEKAWTFEDVNQYKEYNFGFFCSSKLFVHLIFSLCLCCILCLSYVQSCCSVKTFPLTELLINCKWTTKLILKFSFANHNSSLAFHEDI